MPIVSSIADHFEKKNWVVNACPGCGTLDRSNVCRGDILLRKKSGIVVEIRLKAVAYIPKKEEDLLFAIWYYKML